MKQRIPTFDVFVNEASQDTESIKVVTTEKSYKTLTSELDNNRISYTHDKDNKYTLIFDNTPKSRMAIKLTKERNGMQSIKIVTE